MHGGCERMVSQRPFCHDALRLAAALYEVGRPLVQMAYNRIEPAEVRLLPTRLWVGLDEYRHHRRTPRNLFCLLGQIRWWQMVYRAVEPGTPGLFPLEQDRRAIGDARLG
ncbi:MAG: hypothetical protein ACYC0Y_17880 [Pirellulales bacterium]